VEPDLANMGTRAVGGKVRCLNSISIGIPAFKFFRDDVLHVGGILVAMATMPEHTSERFCQGKSYLDCSSRYFRFKVAHKLE
jgi:hypothetical protein